MRRLSTTFLAFLLLAGVLAPAVGLGAGTARAADAVPKVVVIVGPSGAATDRYRAEARQAARLARTYTPDVTELYSPNATWPAVRQALQGASVVIYMGHGNGWPSRYRDSLHGTTQNGFGLNPEAGGSDDRHQYFGESVIARQVKLAKDAVVLLNHLCYASGNSEPGLPEGNLDTARQRADNFAAGFIKAGASAVVAEAYASPDHMLRAVLGGRGSVAATWRSAPSANGNVIAFESSRSRGYIGQLDPERAASGFERSIVVRSGLVPDDVRAGARGSALAVGQIDAAALAPSLAAAGLTVHQPFIEGGTSRASAGRYLFNVEFADRDALPKGITASARWDPLDPVTDDPAATDDPDAPPNLGLVVPERIGDVVEPVTMQVSPRAMAAAVTLPEAPGSYRLTLTVHDADGVAFDAATQAAFPALIVRVTGDLDATFVAPERIETAVGAEVSIDPWIGNVGRVAWGNEATDRRSGTAAVRAQRPRVTAQWVAVGGSTAPKQMAAAASAGTAEDLLGAAVAPGDIVRARLALVAPAVPGEYLVLLDVVTPGEGSLVAAGVEPALIRVTVTGVAPERR